MADEVTIEDPVQRHRRVSTERRDRQMTDPPGDDTPAVTIGSVEHRAVPPRKRRWPLPRSSSRTRTRLSRPNVRHACARRTMPRPSVTNWRASPRPGLRIARSRCPRPRNRRRPTSSRPFAP